MKGVKANVEAFEKARDKIASLQAELYATTCALYETKVRELEDQAKELQEKIQEQLNTREANINTSNELNDTVISLNAQEREKQREIESLKQFRSEMIQNIQYISAKMVTNKKEIEAKEIIQKELRIAFDANLKQIEKILEEKRKFEEEMKENIKNMKKNGKQNDIDQTSNQVESYYNAKNEAATKTFEMRIEMQKLTAFVENNKQKVKSLMDLSETQRNQLKDMKKQIEENNVESIKEEINRKKEELKEWAKKYETAADKQKEKNEKIRGMEMTQIAAEFELRRLEQEQEFKMQRGRENHLIEQLKTKVRGCRGLLLHLIFACEKKYETAVKFGLGKYLTHLVVDDESAAASCNIFLKRRWSNERYPYSQ